MTPGRNLSFRVNVRNILEIPDISGLKRIVVSGDDPGHADKAGAQHRYRGAVTNVVLNFRGDDIRTPAL